MVSVSQFKSFCYLPFLIPNRQGMAWVFSHYQPFVLWAYGSVQGLAIVWCGVMAFDLVVVVMTLVRTIQINKRSGKDRTLTQVLIRDGESSP